VGTSACGRIRHSRAAHHCNASSADDLGDAEGSEHFDETVNLVFGAGRFNDERVRADVHDTRAIHVHQLHHVSPFFTGHRDLDQREVA